MKRIVIIATLAVLLFLPSRATAQPPTRDSLMTMLKASGAVEMLNPMLNSLAQQVQTEISKQSPNLPAKAKTIMMDEFKIHMNTIVMEILSVQIDFYSEHLTQTEVNDLTAMYSSPAWKKNIQVGKKFMEKQYMDFMKTRMPELAKDLMIKILTRLKEEGFLKKKETGA